MKFIVTFTRHVDMLNFSELVALILVIMLADVATGRKTTSDIKLEGSISEHDVVIGSNVNLTCAAFWSPKKSCNIMWIKNSKRLDEKMKHGRIQWLLGKQIGFTRRCSVAKFMIRNFSSNDAGKYECLSIDYITSSQTDSEEDSIIQINAVTCYQGFYCPKTETKSEPKRCPTGTFSPYKNATSIKDCLPCPTDKNKREHWKRKMETKIVAMFQTNCHSSSLIQGKTSNLSSGAKVAIIVLPAIATLVFVMGVLYAFRRRKAMIKYREKLFNSFKDVDYDPLKVPRSKDVFVCYSSKNREWVHEILFPKLKSQDFKVFIDFVDFEIGKTIDDNIVKGIYGSRKTLFILSKESLKSLYARKELYHALAAGKTGHQVLVILYEKCKAPAEIADIVYLDWTDEKNRDRFWERLYSAIRRPLPNEVVHV